MFRLTREVRFAINPQPADAPAAHAAPAASPSNSHAGFPSLNGIGYYLALRATLAGELNPHSQYLLNIKQIDAAVRQAIPLAEKAVRARGGARPAELLTSLYEHLLDHWPGGSATTGSFPGAATPTAGAAAPPAGAAAPPTGAAAPPTGAAARPAGAAAPPAGAAVPPTGAAAPPTGAAARPAGAAAPPAGAAVPPAATEAPPAGAAAAPAGAAAPRTAIDPRQLRLENLALMLSPFLSVSLLASELPMTRLSQRFEFSASHRLHNPALSAEENRRIFGKCNNPLGHGHNYELQVTLVGNAGANGLLMEVPALERIVATTVIDRFDHRNLNAELPEFAEVIPSVENIARVIFQLLKPVLRSPDARLGAVTVWETPKTWCEYSE